MPGTLAELPLYLSALGLAAASIGESRGYHLEHRGGRQRRRRGNREPSRPYPLLRLRALQRRSRGVRGHGPCCCIFFVRRLVDFRAISRVKRVEDLNADIMLEVIEEQAQQGVDYMTIHAGVLIQYLPMISKRITGIVSRGGAILAQWMAHHHKQNFLYERFEDIVKICKKYDVSFLVG